MKGANMTEWCTLKDHRAQSSINAIKKIDHKASDDLVIFCPLREESFHRHRNTIKASDSSQAQRRQSVLQMQQEVCDMERSEEAHWQCSPQQSWRLQEGSLEDHGCNAISRRDWGRWHNKARNLWDNSQLQISLAVNEPREVCEVDPGEEHWCDVTSWRDSTADRCHSVLLMILIYEWTTWKERR